jgi:hypothetical protein
VKCYKKIKGNAMGKKSSQQNALKEVQNMCKAHSKTNTNSY